MASTTLGPINIYLKNETKLKETMKERQSTKEGTRKTMKQTE